MRTKNYKRPLLNYVMCLLIALSFNSQSFGQSPNAIPYQGVARDAAGTVLPLQAISIEYIIHDVTEEGTIVFSETHNVTTTSLGLFNLNIGEGTPGTGTLATVDWGNGAKFIEVVLDGTSMGTSQLNSVPYALYAASSGGDFVDLTTDQTIAGTKTFSSDAVINGVRVGKGGGSQVNNTAMGTSALIANTTGDKNSAYGPDALQANTIGRYNSAYGWWSLSNNTNGEENSAYGIQSLFHNTSGKMNTAIGGTTLFFNDTGSNNTAIGNNAGAYNRTGKNNTFIGMNSRVGTDAGDLENATAIGYLSEVNQSNSLILGNNANVGIGTSSPAAKLDVVGNLKTTEDASINGVTVGLGNGVSDRGGDRIQTNTAIGVDALSSHQNGYYNTALGFFALKDNLTGNGNTATGRAALQFNTVGSNNTAMGRSALFFSTGEGNTAFGSLALVGNDTGSYNTGLGYGANFLTSRDLVNATVIGAYAAVESSNSVVIGSIAGINNATETVNVGIGTTTPSQRLDVIGKVKITDGTEGAGKVLTSNDTGVASWQAPGGTNSVIAFRAQTTVDQILPDETTTISYQDVIFNDGGGFDTGTSIFTAPEDGIYHFDVSVHMNTGGKWYSALYVYLNFSNGQPGGVDVLGGPSHNLKHFTISETVKLNAGDTVYPSSYVLGGPITILGNTGRFSGYKVN